MIGAMMDVDDVLQPLKVVVNIPTIIDSLGINSNSRSKIKSTKTFDFNRQFYT